mmetsp:Transcript_61043/g.189077  ORF Transcript_61043/g.189077 Transcript_61043/m.189077 type:complete len:317 (+) Transcript_61043:69-1019(+)|eukprot:CAMPEP_0204594508 /NCGR_PEP_ID=MMETSP0661-20131031/52115_1 /ASSEMBLY_ACC=CAM_ASM_000606 /TAXON_ID=109239 /ORGANISM="Alexandrium margalefi, Strain AMGDE01CS-322" /LENGTH=316 /DNA_ID=CAMNT_0051604911 /DNA_START=69 /DNA_END=1019 /DNA_ORIENTATION=+
MGGKSKIKTHASKEAMRWADDGKVGDIVQEPTSQGNKFDLRMQEEEDGTLAARKIVDKIKERGVALVQANAPKDLVMAANEEAEALWEDNAFLPPLRVHDDRTMLEAPLWQQTLQDEEKVFWIRPKDKDTSSKTQVTNGLRILSDKIAEFGGGLGELLHKEMGVHFDRFGHAMLSCYTGDRTYALHLDNCHGEEEDEEGFPDNGMRLTLVYFINMYWNPIKRDNGGGLDFYLTDPQAAPSAAGDVKSAKVLRIAPHADTLALFLSERMAHRVVQTQGDQKWFCLTMWCLNGEAMGRATKKLIMRRQAKKDEDSDED